MDDNSPPKEKVQSDAVNFFQVETDKMKNTEESEEVLVCQEIKKSISVPESKSMYIDEIKKVEESDKSDLDGEKPSIEESSKQINEPLKKQDKDIPIKVEESVKVKTLTNQQSASVTGQILSTSYNLKEFEVPVQKKQMEPTQEQMGQENVMKCKQQVIPVTKSVLNNDMQLKDNEAHLKKVFNLKLGDFENIVMSELSDFLSVKPLQHIETPNLETNSVNIKNDKDGHNKFNLSEAAKTILMNEIMSENILHDDPLSTLASAALNQESPTNVIINNDMLKSVSPAAKIQQEGPAWCDVGVIKGNNCLVKQFYATSISDEHENTSIDFLPDYQNKLKIDIEPGATYKFRIAAINACGRGEWSDIAIFKTCVPGYPSAPCSIKITKTSYGASLKWEIPPNNCGQILEYSVCLAVKKFKEGLPRLQTTATTSDFVRVYCGPHNTAKVSHESLRAALIDMTHKPAILFRIAAKNEKGYGPATQVRWLQDTKVSNKREKAEDLLTFETKKTKF